MTIPPALQRKAAEDRSVAIEKQMKELEKNRDKIVGAKEREVAAAQKRLADLQAQLKATREANERFSPAPEPEAKAWSPPGAQEKATREANETSPTRATRHLEQTKTRLLGLPTRESELLDPMKGLGKKGLPLLIHKVDETYPHSVPSHRNCSRVTLSALRVALTLST